MKKLNYYLATLVLILASAFVLHMGYMATFPFEPVTLHSISIDKDKVKVGECLNVRLIFTKNMSVNPISKWYLIDGIVYQLPMNATNRGLGNNDITRCVQIPQVTPGAYKVKIDLEYNVHLFHTPILYSWETPEFEVK